MTIESPRNKGGDKVSEVQEIKNNTLLKITMGYPVSTCTCIIKGEYHRVSLQIQSSRNYRDY